MRVDWCVSSWFRIKNTHSLTEESVDLSNDMTGRQMIAVGVRRLVLAQWLGSRARGSLYT